MPEKILIVEDDINTADFIRQSLAELFQNPIKIASNPTQALAYIQQVVPDLVVIDIQLTGKKTGIWLAEQIEAMDTVIPYIFVSSYVDHYKEQMAKYLEPAGFISKPFSVAEIQLQVQLVLRLTKSAGNIPTGYQNKTRFDFAHPFLFTLDKDATITSMNNEARNALGENSEKHIGSSIYSMIESDEENNSLEEQLTERIAQYSNEFSGTGQLKIENQQQKRIKFTFSLAYHSDNSLHQMTLLVWPVLQSLFDDQSSRILLEAVEQNFNPVLITTAQLDPPGPQIIYANDAYCQMTGYRKDEIKGQTPRMFQGPKTDRDLMDKMKKTIRKGQPFQGVTVNYKKDGSEYYVKLNISPIKNASGEILYYTSVQQDITDQKEAEIALRESEIKFRAHFNQSPLIISHVDSNGRFIEVNQALCDFFGYEKDKIIGENIAKFSLPEDRKTDRRLLNKLFSGEIQSFTKDKKYLTKSGDFKIGQITAKVIRDETGDPMYSVGMMKDVTEERKYQQALEESERRFRHMANNSPVFIWMTDEKGVVTYMNDYYRNYRGGDLEEGEGFNWDNLIHPEDRQNFIDLLNQKMNEAENFRIECRLRDKNDDYRWFLITGAARLGGDGKFLGHVGVCVDIQKQKEALEELREREQQFRMLAESSDDIISLFGLDATCLYNSPRAAEIFGTEYAVKSDESFYKNIYPPDIQTVRKNHKKVLNGLPATFEWRKKIGKDEYMWVETKARPIMDHSGKPEHVLCSTRIVDERKERELSLEASRNKLEDLVKERTRELRSSEMLHRNLFESMHQGVIYFDAEGRIINMNKAAEQIVGKNLSEVMGRSSTVEWVEVFNPDGSKRGPKNSLIMKAIRENKVTQNKTIGVKNERTDTMKWINISVIPIDDKVESTARVYCTMDDITETRNTQQKLVEARNEAQQLAAAKEQFLANMSHEIRTPINGVRGMVHLLEDSDLEGEERQYLNAIKQSTDTLLTVINDILDTSKLERGMLSIENNPFHISEVLQSVRDTLQFKINQSDLDFSIEIDEDVPAVVLGDRARLYQILTNLVGNALKFTHRGYVNLQVRQKKKEGNTHHISFSVADSGVGIEESKRERIFEIFAQEDSSIAKMYGGTGLGLAICKKLVELQNGKITVSSQKNKGATFTFIIPYEKPASQQESDLDETSKEIDGEPLKDHRIMIVDDNKVNIMWTEKLLTNWGADVISVTSGLGAFDQLEKHPVDIILMDIQMPGYDGYETTHFIRNNFKKPISTIPILGVSADVMKGQFQKCINAGMDGYLGKPIEPGELLREIKKCLASRRRSEPESPVSNSDQFKTISTTNLDEVAGDDLSFKKEIVEDILDLVDKICIKMNEAIRQQDAAQIGKLAHTIKPNCKYLELNGYELAKKLAHEAKDRQKPFDEIEDLAKRLVESLNKSKPEIEQLFQYYANKQENAVP